MFLQGDKLVFEIKACTWCEAGQQRSIKRCPNDGKPQRGKACEHCGATTKNHKYLDGDLRPCSWCEGTRKVQEQRTDYMPADVWQALPFRVYRGYSMPQDASMIYSCTDYGEAAKQDDATVLQRVRESTGHQATMFTDDGTPLAVGIFVGRGGYVVAYWDAAQGEPTPPPPPVAAEDKPRVFAEVVAKQVTEMQSLGSGAWLKTTGQWLVYGLERQIGFNRGVELCSVVERAWKAKQPLAPAIEAIYREWTKGGAS